jgi:hypothetical protein
MAENRIWMPVADALTSGFPVAGFTCAPSRYIITIPRPLSSAASGSSSGSAHGANLRMARWAARMITMKAPRYSAVPEGSVPLRLKPTFAKANRTSAKANTSMISSVRRLLRPPGTSGLSGSTAGVGAVMLLTSVPWPRSPTRLG